jgi:hypothetical protein
MSRFDPSLTDPKIDRLHPGIRESFQVEQPFDRGHISLQGVAGFA